MKQNGHRNHASLAGLAAIGLALAIGGTSDFAAAQDAPITDSAMKANEQK